jgi:multidrug efflux pump subunit AcrB
MLRVLHKYGFGMLFAIVAGLMVSVTVAPVRAADLVTNEKILDALKAKRLTRCPQVVTRCGGARLQTPPPEGRLVMSKSLWTAAPPLSAQRK